MKRTLGLILSLAVEWSLVGDEWSLIATSHLPVDRSQDATALGMDAQIKQRKADYRRAREAAERDGRSIYRSAGKPGDALPRGLYELIRDGDGEVWYREVEPAGVPIPRPDPAVIRDYRNTEECVT